MNIKIRELKIDAIIGIFDFERIEHQRIIVNADIQYDYSSRYFLDYSEIVDVITSSIEDEGYKLIEEAINSIANILHRKFPAIKSLTLEIQKPDIMPNCNVSASESWEF